MNSIEINDIQNQLKKSVFGQDELLKTLSVIAWTHEVNMERKLQNKEPINNKTLIVGSSGTGKTFAVKKLAELINVPFIEIDCSKINGNNYVGCNHVYDIFNEPVQRLGKSAVEHAIVFFDEFDKTLDVYNYKKYGSNIVQRDFLKLFDKNSGEQSVYNISTRSSDTIDTTYMTFICAGSFYETMNASSDKEQPNKMGFGVNTNQNKKEITFNDLISMGHLPELMGRFSRIINMNLLSENDIYNILTKGESQITIYKELLKEKDIDLNYSNEYFRYLSKNISLNKTGFRDVDKLICNDIDDIIVNLNDSVKKVIVDIKNNSIMIDFLNNRNRSVNKIEKQIANLSHTPIYKIKDSIKYDLDMD